MRKGSLVEAGADIFPISAPFFAKVYNLDTSELYALC